MNQGPVINGTVWNSVSKGSEQYLQYLQEQHLQSYRKETGTQNFIPIQVNVEETNKIFKRANTGSSSWKMLDKKMWQANIKSQFLKINNSE